MFSLLKLPYLPQHLTIMNMDIQDIIRLSMCSKRVARIVKMCKHKLNRFAIYLKPDNSYIGINSPRKMACVELVKCNNNEHVSVEGYYLYDRCLNENSNFLRFRSDSFETTMLVSKSIRSQFVIDMYSWHIHVNAFEECDVRNFLSSVHFNECNKLILVGRTISSDLLNLIMDMNRGDLDLDIDGPIPLGFKQEKAFYFRSCRYLYAEWVTLDHLFTLNNPIATIRLIITKFANEDLNRFLHFWILSDVDMFKILRFQLKLDIKQNADIIFADIIRLSLLTFPDDSYYFLSKQEKKKNWIGCIKFDGSMIHIESLPVESCSDWIVSILKSMELQRELNIELKRALKEEKEDEERQIQTILEVEERNRIDNNIQQLNMKKEELKKKLKLTEKEIITIREKYKNYIR